MIYFFGNSFAKIYAVQTAKKLNEIDQKKLVWLFGNNSLVNEEKISGDFIGPRASMVTPWSTNAVEITQNMDITGINRIERFNSKKNDEPIDPMLFEGFNGLDQTIFEVDITPDPIISVSDIKAYNQQEGLALSLDEIHYLEELSKKIRRELTDSEVFGFSQVNSEHCRHKIFNGQFVFCLLYTSPSPRDATLSRMPSSA